MNIVVLLFVAVSLLVPRVSMGHGQSDRRLSVHGLLGAFTPTGRHRSVVGDAFAICAQVGLGLRASVALVGGVLISQTSYKSPLRGDVTVVQYDVGFEFAPSAPYPIVSSPAGIGVALQLTASPIDRTQCARIAS